jgi:gamma-glutamyltranspeptidase/glutathione hydrolase
MSGIGGRTAGIIRHPDGSVAGIDGLNQVPRSYRSDSAPGGYDRVAIPGVPAALEKVRAEHGTWPMDRLLAQAIELAEAGFILREAEADRWAGAAEELRAHPAALGTYLRPDGSPWPTGSLIRQPDLARTLRAMAEGGVDVFYRGWVADSIDADMRRVGGFITRPELEAYEALPAILIEGTYRDHTLLGTFRPASGHSVIQSLQIFEAATPDGVSGAGQATDEARWMALLGQSMEIGIRERNRVEDSEEASAAFLTSLDRAREHAQTLIDPAMMEVTGAAASLAASNALVRAGTRVGLGSYLADPHDRESTTHLTAMDQDGRIISLTLSLGPSMGARIVAPGLGFLYATRLGNEPGSRPSSTIAPTLVLRPDGDLLAGLGGAGDARIISAVIQTIARMVDHEMPLDEAVAAPRIHPEGPRHLRAETGGASLWRPDALGRFVGWEFQLTETPSSYFGRVHAIGWDPVTRQVLAVAEPRWDGGVSAPTLAPVSP